MQTDLGTAANLILANQEMNMRRESGDREFSLKEKELDMKRRFNDRQLKMAQVKGFVDNVMQFGFPGLMPRR